ITLVLQDEEVFIHVSQELTPCITPKEGPIEAVDFGYTEIMTDTEGQRYGIQFGKLLSEASDARHVKMQKRHKLHAMQK
ncbi:hypothetical protein, partial [Escherichia coli]|uniref:hypothetical protein n=1 Tax=Escherichia coli TaxID=562 RepID=UPI003F460C1D